MTSFAFPKTHHLRRPAEFDKVYGGKCRAGDALLLVFAARSDLPHARIGLSVSKKHGGAVVRNRIKRLLREAYRLSQQDVPRGCDFVLIPRVGVTATLADWQKSVVAMTRLAARRLPREGA